MEITNFYTPGATSTLKIVKWNSEEDYEEMDIDHYPKTEQEDLIPPGIYDWWRNNQAYQNLLDSTIIGDLTNKEIYSEFEEFVGTEPSVETYKNSKESVTLAEDNIDQICNETDIDLKAKILYLIMIKQF